MKEYPHIKFGLNRALDEKMLIYFVANGSPKAGFNFIDEIVSLHPKVKTFLPLVKEKQEQALNKFVGDFYKSHLSELKRSAITFQDIWDEIEDRFFIQCAKLFSCPWPKGKYRGYISALPIGPRFLEDKTFQTCWLWRKNLKGQVIHELLHFQFYNLASLTGFDKLVDEDKLWEISEIFNDVVQCQPDFIALQGYAPKVGYPGHKNKITKYKKIWLEGQSTNDFFKKIAKDIR